MKKVIQLLTIISLVHAHVRTAPLPAPQGSSVRSVLRSIWHGTRNLLGALRADNFRPSVSGRLYRANTMHPELLSGYIKAHNIKTIINLRGVQESKSWWVQERNVAREYNVAMHDVTLRSFTFPPPQQLAQLLEIFKASEGPVLVHCHFGVDRTGTASALWHIEKEGASAQKALGELSYTQYGHLGWLFGQMRSFISLWAALRQSYSAKEALQEYQALYKELDLASVDKATNLRPSLRHKLNHIQALIAALGSDAYAKHA